MSKILNEIWIYKHAPKDFDSLILQNKNTVVNFLKNSKLVPSFLFYSDSPGSGKCLGKGTKVLMYDGTIKKVENILTDELVMGWDSKPRKVLSTCSGNEKMYKINPNIGDSWKCNESHILSLVMSMGCDKGKYKKNEIVNISVKDYLKSSKSFRHYGKLFYNEFNFNSKFINKHLDFDPYMIGMWLGDGNKDNPIIYNNEPELFNYYENFAEKHNLIYTRIKEESRCYKHSFTHGNRGGKENKFRTKLKSLITDNKEKQISKEYLINTRENRLKLLAGLLDSDGDSSTSKFGYGSIVTKYKKLRDDILFLSASLGFTTTNKKIKKGIKDSGFIGEYYIINIMGNLDIIPSKIKRKNFNARKQKKKHNRSGFIIEKDNSKTYYGFELDGDGMFLLWNGCVTHNTTTANLIIDHLKCDSLRLNGSKERGIDVIREKVHPFVMSLSSNPGVKRCVFFDEAERLTSESQDSLKNLMDTYSANCFFIFSCNTVSKIIKPIQSRCGCIIDFGRPDEDEIYNKLEGICKAENYSNYVRGDLLDLVEYYYPDIRAMVNKIQECSVDGKELGTDKTKFKLFLSLIKKKDVKAVYQMTYSKELDIIGFNKWMFNEIFKESDQHNLDKFKDIVFYLADNEKAWGAGSNIEIVFLSNVFKIMDVI